MAPQQRYTSAELTDLSVLWSGDVIVAGGGSAGATAAIAASRAGSTTLVVESEAFLGGTGSRILDTFYGFYPPGAEGLRVVGGIGWEVCRALFDRGQAFERPNTYGAGTGVTYDPEALKLVWDELTSAAGVDVLFHTLVTGIVIDEQILTGLVVETRQGPALVHAKVIIDASGEGDVARRAGATVRNGEIDQLQPATATFRMGGVAAETASTPELHRLMTAAVENGRYQLPRQEGSIHVTTIDGIRHANMTRVSGQDLSDPWQLTAAEQDGRRQVWEYSRFLINEVPGYSQSYLLGSSSRLGIRESHRLAGEYVLDRADFAEALSHPDDIARCGAPIEDHGNGSTTRWEYVGAKPKPDGSSYGIPFGTLVPAAIDGLLVAGRCLSATHDAHASVRSIAQCMAMGQASGTAAAIAAREGVKPRAIDRDELRATLALNDAIV